MLWRRVRRWQGRGRDRSAVVDWCACRFVLMGLVPTRVPLKSALARLSAFWRRPKSPFLRNIQQVSFLLISLIR